MIQSQSQSQWICRRCLLQKAMATGRPRNSHIVVRALAPKLRYYSSDASSSITNAELTLRSVTFLSDSLLRRARQLSSEQKALEEKLMDSFDQKIAAKAGSLRTVSEALKDYEKTVENLEELRSLLADTKSPDMQELAAEDVPSVASTLASASRHLTKTLVPIHPFAHKSAILEIRPGTGGGEAAIFANDLFKMYTSYCSIQSWPTRVISVSTTSEQGGEGVSEAIFAVRSPGSYGVLRHEAGVHRVQRIPTTERQGRVHTSTANVMVLPSFEDDLAGEEDELSAIDMKEVRIDIMKARGAGGQHVNTTDSAVRMTHEPTGIVVSMQDSRSQHKNREMALQLLRARVAEKRRKEKEEEELKLRRTTVGVGAGRSDKLRTYNFSQNRVTDHRGNISLHDLPSCMAGEGLNELLEKVATHNLDMEIEALIREQEEKQQAEDQKST